MDRGAWWAIVHGVSKSQVKHTHALSDLGDDLQMLSPLSDR